MWNWSKIDELVASFARPYQQYSCSTACWVALIWVVAAKESDIAITIAFTTCGGLAGWSAALRSTDKKTAASVDIAQANAKTATEAQ